MSVFGETLKQARAHKGVTVKEAEQATRINRLHLAALEEENFAALPPLIYQRGIVRNYATYLDLEPSKLIGMFDGARGGGAAPISVIPSIPPVDMPRQWVPNFAVLAFLIVMSAVVFSWFYSAYFASGEPQATATAPPPSVTPPPSNDPTGLESWSMVQTKEPAPTEAATPESTRDDANADGGAEGPDDDAGDAAAVNPTRTPEPEEETVVPDEPVDDAVFQDPVFRSPEEDVSVEPETEETAPPSGDMTQLQFTPSADLTISIIGDGVVLYDGFVSAGTILGPFDAVSFEIYTSNVGNTNITNVATGVTFQMAYDEGELLFYLP